MFEDKINQDVIDRINILKNQLANKIVPDTYPNEISSWDYNRFVGYGKGLDRDDIIKLSSFPIISNDWLSPLAEWIGDRKCLEIMAGTGMLSRGLSNFGIDIMSTDNFSWISEHANWFNENSTWYPVENIDCIDAIEKYGKNTDIIICSWAYMDDGLYNALLKMRETNPKCLMIYVGEGDGGCTASDKFFESLIEVDDSGFNNAVKNFRSWWGIYDRPMLIK